MKKQLAISDADKKILLHLLNKYLPSTKAWAYGSRVTGKARPASDLDLVVFANREQSLQVADLREAFEESDLTFRVDLFVWDSVPESFKATIEKEHVVLCDTVNEALQEHTLRYGKEVGESAWKKMTLGELCSIQQGSIQTGPFGSQLHSSDYIECGIPVVMPTNIGDFYVVSDGIAMVSEGNAKRLSQHSVIEGDVLFSRRGDVTKCARIKEHEVGWLCGTGCLKVRWGNESVAASRFVSHCLRMPDVKEWLVRHAVGATMPNLNTSILSNIQLAFPVSREEQIQIADFVDALDDRIQLLRETNATLEAMAQALFKSWFVDFDPVHAKAEGRTPEGMDAETAALFPAEFEESELGMIPKGWRCGSLIDIASYLNGLALQKYPASEGKSLPVIKIAQLRKGNTEGADRASASLPNDYIVQDGDVLFSWSGSLEVEIWCGGVGALNQHLFKVSSEKYPKWFYYFWTKYHLNEFRMIAASKATTMGHIQRKHLTEASILIPSGDALKKIDAYFSHYIDLIVNNLTQARTLTALRDTLLPRLISGKLRLPEFTDTTTTAAP